MILRLEGFQWYHKGSYVELSENNKNCIIYLITCVRPCGMERAKRRSVLEASRKKHVGEEFNGNRHDISPQNNDTKAILKSLLKFDEGAHLNVFVR